MRLNSIENFLWNYIQSRTYKKSYDFLFIQTKTCYIGKFPKVQSAAAAEEHQRETEKLLAWMDADMAEEEAVEVAAKGRAVKEDVEALDKSKEIVVIVGFNPRRL